MTATDLKFSAVGTNLSPRLHAVVNALPLEPGLRVLEIGCGPGAAAREVARRVGIGGAVLAIDRSAAAIAQAERASRSQTGCGTLQFRTVSAAELLLAPGEPPYDLAFAVRVGALDGRHPDETRHSLDAIRSALTPSGRLFVDGGDPLREIDLRSVHP
jgi:precorrin-6B methylase 2